MGNTIQISMHRSDFGDINWRLVNERDLTHQQINAILRTVEARRSDVPATATYRSGLVVDVEMGAAEPAPQAEPQAEAAPEAEPTAEAQQPAPVAPAAKKAPAPKAEDTTKADRIEAAKAFIEANPGASARAVAAHLGLTGSFAVQQATAALTALVKRGLATKEAKDGQTVYTLVGAKKAKKAKKGGAK
ncbi:MAG: hypothetical protein AB7W59_00425 [Acidimicrobiia bacterium]